MNTDGGAPAGREPDYRFAMRHDRPLPASRLLGGLAFALMALSLGMAAILLRP